MRLFAASLVLALATAVGGEAAVLEDAEVREAGALILRLHLSSSTGVLARTLPATDAVPDRIYLDVADTQLGASVPAVLPGRGSIVRVRMAQYDLHTVRVVLDLREALPFRLVTAGGNVAVELGSRPAPIAEDSHDVTPPPPPPAAPAPPPRIDLARLVPPLRRARRLLPSLSAAATPPLPASWHPAPTGLAMLSPAATPPLPSVAPPRAPAVIARAEPPPAADVPGPPAIAEMEMSQPAAEVSQAAAEASQPAARPSPRAAPPRAARPRAPSTAPLRHELVVVIDAGHGGRDPGAAGIGGVLEKDVVLAISRRLADRLLARLPVSVLLTRADDSFVPIERRLPLEDDGAVVFVSLHANACAEPSARGLEVFFGGGQVRTASTGATDSRAALLGRTISRALAARVGGVRGDARPAGFHVLVHNPVPSVLVEVGYLTHPEEAARTQDPAYQELLADALVDGVAEFLRASSAPL
jgi:N-acetylmuramoyl-L-alanine amidase